MGHRRRQQTSADNPRKLVLNIARRSPAFPFPTKHTHHFVEIRFRCERKKRSSLWCAGVCLAAAPLPRGQCCHPAPATSDEHERFFRTAPHPRPHTNIEQKGQGGETGRHRNVMERSVFFARTGLPNLTAGSNVHHGAGHGLRRVTRSEEPPPCY